MINAENDEETENFYSRFGGLDDLDDTVDEPSQPNQRHECCNNCLQLEVQLQKSAMVITKLQKRCADKTSEIKRLRLSEKRSKLKKKALEDLLSELKEKNWISDEGRDVLKVIEPNIYRRLV